MDTSTLSYSMAWVTVASIWIQMSSLPALEEGWSPIVAVGP